MFRPLCYVTRRKSYVAGLLSSALMLYSLSRLLLTNSNGVPRIIQSILRLFSDQNNELAIFDRHSPQTIHTILNKLHLTTPTLAYNNALTCQFSRNDNRPLYDFTNYRRSVFGGLPTTINLNVTLRVTSNSAHILQVDATLRHRLHQRFAPFALYDPTSIGNRSILHVLLCRSHRRLPVRTLLRGTLKSGTTVLHSRQANVSIVILAPNTISTRTVLNTIYLPVGYATSRLAITTKYDRVLRLIHRTERDIIPTSTPIRLHLTTNRAALASRSANTTTRFFCNLIQDTRTTSWGLYGISYGFSTKSFLFKEVSDAVGRAVFAPHRHHFLTLTTTTTIYVIDLTF